MCLTVYITFRIFHISSNILIKISLTFPPLGISGPAITKNQQQQGMLMSAVAKRNCGKLSKKLRVPLIISNLIAHESTIRTTLNNRSVHDRVARRKPLLSKKNIAASLQFAKNQVDKP